MLALNELRTRPRTELKNYEPDLPYFQSMIPGQMEDAVRIFRAAIAAVQPARLLREYLVLRSGSLVVAGQTIPLHGVRHIYVVGAGKAAAAMAVEAEAILGDLVSGGVVTVPYGHRLPTSRVKVLEAAHPTPDVGGMQAVDETLELLRQVTDGDVVICLLSGGASALWCDPPSGIALTEVQATNDILIRSGASIGEINTVRKHLSRIKGGQLIRYCGGAKVVSLVISDVPGDALDSIASGPTVADPSTFGEACAVLVKYSLWSQLPSGVTEHLDQGRQGGVAETPKPGDPFFHNTATRIIGSNRVALLAAEGEAKALGYHTLLVPEPVTGDAEAEAQKLVVMAMGYRGPKPHCILQGGETTVRVTGSGKGGRNQHFALAALQAMGRVGAEALARLTILSGGTDGTDGPTDAAGGVVDGETLRRAEDSGLVVQEYLCHHNAYPFLQQTGSLLVTGPTQTNVMDIMMAIVT